MRRFSQAISEGDGISLLAEVENVDSARGAAGAGAEAIVVRGGFEGVRDATELPILWSDLRSLEEAHRAGADACVLVVADFEEQDGRLEREHAAALELGLDCVVEVRDEDQLQLALDRVDPDILLLSTPSANAVDGLEHVLGLLLDVPAGKLAVAQVDAAHGEVVELERAGIDAVIVRSEEVAGLTGGPAP